MLHGAFERSAAVGLVGCSCTHAVRVQNLGVLVLPHCGPQKPHVLCSCRVPESWQGRHHMPCGGVTLVTCLHRINYHDDRGARRGCSSMQLLTWLHQSHAFIEHVFFVLLRRGAARSALPLVASAHARVAVMATVRVP